MDKKSDEYWNYTFFSKGQIETWKNKKFEITRGLEPIRHYDIYDNNGKYGSLLNAVKGFISDELNNFSKIKIEQDEDDPDKLKITAEVYYDMFGQPVNDVIFRRWKRGEYEVLTHAFVEAIFVKHTHRQADMNEFNEIKNYFKDNLI